jgi:hypothetical protein
MATRLPLELPARISASRAWTRAGGTVVLLDPEGYSTGAHLRGRALLDGPPDVVRAGPGLVLVPLPGAEEHALALTTRRERLAVASTWPTAGRTTGPCQWEAEFWLPRSGWGSGELRLTWPVIGLDEAVPVPGEALTQASGNVVAVHA